MKRKRCINCGKECNNKYCSLFCQNDYQYKQYIGKWKQGIVSGYRGIKDKKISHHVKRYLFIKNNSSCQLCGWNKLNNYCNKIPLEIHHIDGDWENNKEDNLLLLCPNCHSLTSNYKARSKGRIFR